MEVIKAYEPKPHDSKKSFYGKCTVEVMEDGTEILKSYNTYVMSRDPSGGLHRHWNDYTATTGRHVMAFCGIGKAEYNKMKVEEMPA